MKEITVIANNEVGTLAAISEALSNVGVNIEAISAYEQNNKAVFRLVTNDSVTASKALSKLPELHFRESEVLIIKMPNKPGELSKITRKLAREHINLESVYIVTRAADYTEIAVKPAQEDFQKAKNLLK